MWLQFTFLPLIVSVASAAVGNADSTVKECPSFVNGPSNDRNVPSTTIGNKQFFLETFVKLNWYRAAQFCRYHGMNLASISSEEENNELVNQLLNYGYNVSIEEGFWTSGTDLGKEGSFIWMSNGFPLVFQNWASRQPDNSGGNEHCLHLWNYEDQGFKWNDMSCLQEYFFVCEIS